MDQLLGLLLGGGIGVLISGGKPSETPTSDLPPASLRFEAEFARTRAAISHRESTIELARADECDAVYALRKKQQVWDAENPGVGWDDENAEYMAFIEPELSAADAAMRHTLELKLESNSFIQTEHERLHAFYDACLEQEGNSQESAPADT
jgi:hypothetical protein